MPGNGPSEILSCHLRAIDTTVRKDFSMRRKEVSAGGTERAGLLPQVYMNPPDKGGADAHRRNGLDGWRRLSKADQGMRRHLAQRTFVQME
jgi:hypothetical protein